MLRYRFLLVGVLLAILAPSPATAQDFEFASVVERARALAATPYQAPQPVPQFLRDLTYDQYREIRFLPEASRWREGESDFQVMLMAPGSYYGHTVAIHEVDADGVRPLVFDKADFTFPGEGFAKRIPADLGHAGFMLTYPMAADSEQDQFLVFAGASYFRGVGADNHFGLSGRGIAIDTGLASGEEYPAFTAFWLVRPAADSDAMVVYALLDGPSVTGAYRFTAYPGATTRLDVDARLFFRDGVSMLGLAPLTSMFYYGENTARPVGEWRPQVHDSDGLLLHDGLTGEWLWRPLINPRSLRISYHQATDIRGFGLIQRDRAFHHFEDAEARYDQRPSAWVEPVGDWGVGEVVLVEIPTRDETHDNVVAFWRPDGDVEADQALELSYRLYFGGEEAVSQPSGRAQRTFVGDGNRVGGGAVEGALRFVVDFADGDLAQVAPDAAVVSDVTGGEGTEVLEHYVEYLPAKQAWRLAMLLRPAPGELLSARAFLKLGDRALTETWTYELPAQTGVSAPLP